MRFPWGLGIIGLTVGVVAAHPEAVHNLYDQLYPKDEAKRQALDLCFLANRQFNRLDPEERDACFHQRLSAANEVTTAAIGLVPANIGVNFVDLRRQSAEGRLPQNDVRFEQQNERYTRSR